MVHHRDTVAHRYLDYSDYLQAYLGGRVWEGDILWTGYFDHRPWEVSCKSTLLVSHPELNPDRERLAWTTDADCGYGRDCT